MIAGYVAGHHLPNFPVWILVMVATFVLIFSIGLLSVSAKVQLHRYWSLPFLLGVFSASLLYYQQSRKFPEIWEILPAREANLTIKVKRLYASNNTSLVKGIAEIIETEDHLNPLLGFPIYFSIQSDGHSIERGKRLQSNGILNYLPAKDSLTIFETYLVGQSVSLTLTRAQLREAPQQGNAFELLIGKLRRKAIDTLAYQMVEYPEELSIYRG